MKSLLCCLALFAGLPVHAAEIVIFGDSWAKPMGPALQWVLDNHGHEDVNVHTTKFWGLAVRLGSPEGLAYITQQLDLHPEANIVTLSVGYNDVHCDLDGSTCHVRWRPGMAGTLSESEILDSIVLDTEKIVDHIASIRPGAKVLLQSYDFMRPLEEIATKGTPPENNTVHLKWADRVAKLAQRKPTLTFVNLHGLMQVTYGFDGIAHTIHDPSEVIPPGDPSLPDPNLPSPYPPFGNDRTHLNRDGLRVLAEAHYQEFYGPLLEDSEPGINGGHSGAWFNPEISGQGQMIDIDPTSQFMFLAWFTFTDAASGNPGQQHWYTAQGNYSGNKAELILHETLGGKFDDPQDVATRPVGTATISFSDCEQGQMVYSIDTDGRAGTTPLIRAIPGSGNVCKEQSSKAAIITEAVDINAGMDGAWYDTNTPGQGFFIDAYTNPDGGDFIFVAWFTYGDDAASGQRWFTAQGDFTGSTAEIDIYETTSGSFNDPQPSATNKVGAMTIDFTDCSNAILAYSLTDESIEGGIAIRRLLIPGAQEMCEELAGAD